MELWTPQQHCEISKMYYQKQSPIGQFGPYFVDPMVLINDQLTKKFVNKFTLLDNLAILELQHFVGGNPNLSVEVVLSS